MRTVGLLRVLGLSLLVGGFFAQGCSDDCDFGEGGVGSAELGLVRGRVRDADGKALERVTVRVEGQSARTDSAGHFELEVPAGDDRRLRVDSPDFAGGEAVVRVARGDVTSLDLSVMPVRTLRIADAAKGGRLEGDDGFALELPERALRTSAGEVARGRAELRYALVRSPGAMRVPPDLRTRDADGNDVRLRSHGLVEVRFYQGDERLDFEGEARTEVPLPEGSRLRKGDAPGMYHYDVDDLRWVRETEARIDDGKWIARLDRFSWWTAAEPIDALACLSANLRAPSGEPAQGAVVTAVGLDALWLSTAVSDDEGAVCVEAPPETTVALSAFFESDGERGQWSLEQATADEAGMCGGDACTALGDQDFEGGPLAPPGGGPAGDGGSASMDGGASSSGDGGTSNADGGALFGGLMQSGQTGAPGETVTFTFDAVGGERLAYRISSTADTTADVVVVDPSGQNVSAGFDTVGAGSEAFQDAFVLPEVAGEYRVEVTPRSGGQGGFMLDLFGVPDDASADVAVDGAAVPLTLGSVAQNGVLRFDAAGGERLAFTLSSTTNTTTDVQVVGPTGNSVTGSFDTVGTNSQAFRDAFVLPGVAGTYSIEVDPRQQGTGTVTVQLFSVPDDDVQSISVGGQATVTMGSVAQNGAITLSASGGERLAYTLTSTTTTTVDVSLVDQVGVTVSGAFDTVGATSTAFRDAFELPEVPGTYTFRVDPRQQGVGSVTLALIGVPPDDTLGPFTLASYAGSSVRAFTTDTPGQNAAATYGASAQALVAYYVTNDGDTSVDTRLVSPTGGVVSGSADAISAGGTGFHGPFELPVESGPYTFELNPRAQGTGNYTVQLFEVTPATVSVAAVFGDVAGAFLDLSNVPGQTGEVTFTPGAGTDFIFEITGDGGTNPQTADLTLIAPDMSEVDISGATTVSNTGFTDSDPITAVAGTYTLVVDLRQDGLNTYTVVAKTAP